MKEIRLYRGEICKVDDADFEELSKFRWHLAGGYARRWRRPDEPGRAAHVRMHRQIMSPPDELEVDHINGDKLDNRSSNLRLASHAQNCRNQRLSKRNTAGLKGVTQTRGGMFVSQIRINGTGFNLGTYSTAEHAHTAYRAAAKILFGPYANNGHAVADSPNPKR